MSLEVTCAIIRNEDNEVLIVQRGENSDHPLKWEFPGGKTDKGESHEECIIREISEELSMEIIICKKLLPVDWDYGKKHILLIPFICDTLDELPVLSEHIDFKWVEAERLNDVDFSEADHIVAQRYLSDIRGQEESNGHNEHGSGECFDENELKDIINRMMSQNEADWMAVSAIENPVIFRKLVEYSYSGERKLAFRASWTLSKVCDRHPEIIHPWLNDIAESINKIENESVERSFLRILSLADIKLVSQKNQGLLADHCFQALNSPSSAIAIKVFSMEILYKLAVIYPELANELAVSIRSLMEEGSAGMVARGNMILRKISEIPLGKR
jgi:8-oxo-dGTP diphosphatase